MVRPCSWRDRPTAKSQMSIISCTSPRPSADLAGLQRHQRPSAALAARSLRPAGAPARRAAGLARCARPGRRRVRGNDRRPQSTALRAPAQSAAVNGRTRRQVAAMVKAAIGHAQGGQQGGTLGVLGIVASINISADGLHLARLLVRAAEAVGQEVGQRHLFLADEASAAAACLRGTGPPRHRCRRRW
jgi:hypothetical protein